MSIKIETIEELFQALGDGEKIYNENWDTDEYIYYFEGEVLDEHYKEVNLIVLMNNWDEGDFYYKSLHEQMTKEEVKNFRDEMRGDELRQQCKDEGKDE